MKRRLFLGAGTAALANLPKCSYAQTTAPSTALNAFAPPGPIAPLRASADRIIDLNVCLRPFRAQGPRIASEQRYGKTIVHHYGHGGSGWSLSWGSARLALPLIRASGHKQIAVIGCGAIGLTTARVAQMNGMKVRIYCKERPPEVASSKATGLWSPDSRICSSEYATPAWTQAWASMARSSFKTYQSLLGLADRPVEWRDGYILSDIPFDQPLPDSAHGGIDEPDYPDLIGELDDIRPKSVLLRPGEHPFRVAHAKRFTQMSFNISSYQRLLMDDFLRAGGEIVHEVFEHPRQFGALRERTVVNCTGYGARALLGDKSIIPVRGQTARLVPQIEVDYALIYRGHNLFMLPRRDGVLVQAQGEHDFGNEDTRIDRALSVAAVERLATLFA
ncbi:FAD-binding oxidoreductase [Paucibacter sp. B2R-40]|uniref:FAD-dependent oxidoreductase n=1 Tax=Paucibacter sp. B2R-40 TaxID=2893554 RepID=UPI0021E4684F|nr:FAD-dependent oxidoreductase [Paucibacter sp. B2R-40]MCV2353377.1 FAD-binding oxidoreductase [Paucibacter sp. B2R-40]